MMTWYLLVLALRTSSNKFRVPTYPNGPLRGGVLFSVPKLSHKNTRPNKIPVSQFSVFDGIFMALSLLVHEI